MILNYFPCRSATLEDIYRRYEEMEDRKDDHVTGDDDSDGEEYDGEVTGYVVQPAHTPPRTTPSKLGYGHSAPSGYSGGSGKLHDTKLL